MYSKTRSQLDPNGPERSLGPIRQDEADPGLGQREEKNQDDAQHPQPCVERDPHLRAQA